MYNINRINEFLFGKGKKTEKEEYERLLKKTGRYLC